MAIRPTSDASLPVEVVVPRFCPRRMKKGQVKRYMTRGPLCGYMVACPSCGFIELHMHEKAGYVETTDVQNTERPYTLIATNKPVRCMYCAREIRITDGIISARQVPTEAVT